MKMAKGLLELFSFAKFGNVEHGGLIVGSR